MKIKRTHRQRITATPPLIGKVYEERPLSEKEKEEINICVNCPEPDCEGVCTKMRRKIK